MKKQLVRFQFRLALRPDRPPAPLHDRLSGKPARPTSGSHKQQPDPGKAAITVEWLPGAAAVSRRIAKPED